jgi:stringent starvation protein B
MNSSRPYLLRAIHEWIVDNALTPYMLVDMEADGVVVPRQHGENGRIVLNISPAAVHGLHIDSSAVSFRARFGGIAMDVHVPLHAVLAVYARENGRGMVFNETDDGDEPTPGGSSPGSGRRPSLKVVK